MEELVRYRPDLFIVYSGHNEFLERSIYRKITKTPRVIRGISDLASRSRINTVLKRILAQGAPPGEAGSRPAAVWESEPVTLLDNGLGPSAYTRDEKLKEQTFLDYRFNLGRMVEIARGAGARILFITPASNIKETAPFKSEHRKSLSQSDRQRWRQLYDRARQDYANPWPTNALKALDEAAVIDDLPANLHYVRGRVLEKLGRYPEAKAAYERARDEDVCPLRARGEILTIMAQVAAERKVPLIDFVAFQEGRCKHGIPGAEVFLDHVHPTIESYRLLALEILKTMQKEGIAHPTWDPAIMQRVTQSVLSRIDTKAHSLALMNVCKVMGWAGKREEAYRVALQAVNLRPDIAAVQFEAGLAADLLNRKDEAMAYYRRAVEIQPAHANAHCNLGVILEDRGQLQEAIIHFTLALKYGNPKDAQRDSRNLASATQKLRQEQNRD